jgi:hypothetical protein
MDRNEKHSVGHNPPQRSLDYLRKRSQHRVWWSSARVALRRGRLGEPSISQPATAPSASVSEPRLSIRARDRTVR